MFKNIKQIMIDYDDHNKGQVIEYRWNDISFNCRGYQQMW